MPAPKLKKGQKDGRANNGRPLTYDEAKKPRTLWLTDTAYNILKNNGGGAWIENLLRDFL